MGIIRPTANTTDPADRWAIALTDAPDDLVVGTRATVLAFSQELTYGSISHLVYRRPSTGDDWQLMQGAVQ